MTTEFESFPVSPGEHEEISHCAISVDEEGEWRHEGVRMDRADIVEFFLENTQMTPDGAFFIAWQGNSCPILASDTPFVVSRVDRRTAPEAEGGEEILLTLRHLSGAEPLDPLSLRVGGANVLYCRVRQGRFPARFSRPAYYQLAQWIEEDSATGDFYLELGARRYKIESDTGD